MNSSKIVLNTSASFSSLRIENPKKAGTLTKESENNLKLFLKNVPLVDQLFQIQDMVGEGTFSKVYKAKHKQSQTDFALKCVIPTIKPSRIIPELRYLRDMGGDSNIIEIKTCLYESGYTIIVMPYFQHDRFCDYIKDMNLEEIKEYMRNLLIALRKVHQGKIIHRDVKPNNFLYNRAERKFVLVDFGLAQYEADVIKQSKTYNRQSNQQLINQLQLHNSKKSINKLLSKQQFNHQNQQENLHHSLNNQQSNKITANALFKNKGNDKLIVVRKRLLTDNDDENILPRKYKRFKTTINSPLKQQQFNQINYKSSIFNTPATPIQQQFTVGKAMMNMTNLQNTPIAIDNQNTPTTITPLSFNAIPNFNFSNFDPASKLLTPITPDNSSNLVSNQFKDDLFKTPTKRPINNNVLTQLQNSPNSMIIPETPPKSSNRQDSFNNCNQQRKKVSTLNLNKLNVSPSSITITNNSYHKSKQPTNKSSSLNLLSNSLSSVNLNCKCFGLDQICKICTKRNECLAPRAGTPGFRAPEVLLKHLCQTSAIDIWSAGVIFASLLTKKYPFFRNTDDMTALAEIISIFGTERVQKAAQSIGKHLTSNEKIIEPVNLKETLLKLRGDQMEIDNSAFDLLDKLLDPNPMTRITAVDALNHPFLNNCKNI